MPGSVEAGFALVVVAEVNWPPLRYVRADKLPAGR